MKKIPTIFERDWSGDKSRVLDVINPACQWVFDSEGWPTRKIDGTCCMIRDGKLFKRREIKYGSILPAQFEQVSSDDTTEKVVGWVPVVEGRAEDRWHNEAFADRVRWGNMADGTYELVGPKIQGNPEGYPRHVLISHDTLMLTHDVNRDFSSLRDFLSGQDIEGLVFHHEDGRMAKIKLRDFGLSRKAEGRDTP